MECYCGGRVLVGHVCKISVDYVSTSLDFCKILVYTLIRTLKPSKTLHQSIWASSQECSPFISTLALVAPTGVIDALLPWTLHSSLGICCDVPCVSSCISYPSVRNSL